MLPDIATLGAAGLGVGLVTACWGQIRTLAQRAIGLLVVKVTLSDNISNNAIASLLTHQFKKTANSFPTYMGSMKWVKPSEKEQWVGYEILPSFPTVYWDGWRPLVAYVTSSPGQTERGTVTFVRGFFNPDRLIARAMRQYNELSATWSDGVGAKPSRYRIIRLHGAGRARSVGHGNGTAVAPNGVDPAPIAQDRDVFRPIGYTPDQLGVPCEGTKVLDCMALSGDTLSAAVEARRWYESKKWYGERRIPWRRGWLLHGKPGTGKTTFVNGIAQDLGVPVYSFDVGSMSNQEFSEHWSTALSNSPSIVLIEDIDSVFHGRENILGEMGGGLSFDSLLNTIGGITNANGVLLAITTNNVDLIDPALGIPQNGRSSRPGRLDRMIEMSEPSQEGRVKIARRILEGMTEQQIATVVEDGVTDTGAQFQERCSGVALQHYWNERERAARAA